MNTLSAREIADRYNVSVKTVYNNRNRLEEASGFLNPVRFTESSVSKVFGNPADARYVRLETALSNLSKKMLDRITELENRVAYLEQK